MSRRVAAVVEQSWHRVPGGTAASTIRSLNAVQRRTPWNVIGLAAYHRRAPLFNEAAEFPVIKSRLPRRCLYRLWNGVRRPRIRAAVGNVDVVHATGGVIPPFGSARLVVTVHDLAFLFDPGHFTPHGVRFMSRSWELTLEHATVICVPSKATRSDCVECGAAAERVAVVPWGVTPVAVDEHQRGDLRDRYGLPERFALWVGTSEPRKNLERLIAAHGAVGERLPLVLAGPAGWGPDLGKAISEAGAVRHLGPVPPADLGPLYAAATVFVYPSLREGFGLPVLEAMAQGTAVITSAGTATEEVTGGIGLLVDPYDVAELSAALVGVADDPEAWDARGPNAQAHATGQTWDATAERLAAVYDRAAL